MLTDNFTSVLISLKFRLTNEKACNRWREGVPNTFLLCPLF